MTDFISGKGLVAGIEPKQLLPEWELTKTLRIMKLTAILLLAAALQVTAKGVAQEKINLSLANASLERAFDQIEAQTGFVFIYKDETVKDKKVSIQVTNASLEQALDICLKGQALSYKIIGKSVAIKVEKASAAIFGIEEIPPFIDVRGRVVNEKGDPVEGVTVTVKGTSKNTVTDVNGEFSLATIENDAVLEFTHISMETFELKVSGKTELAINLKTKVTALGDVTITVNTGYQQLPKERATGSFTLVGNELYNEQVGTNAFERLKYVSNGITPLSNRVGTDAKDQILIRGLSTLTMSIQKPLIILDNFEYQGDFNNINPNDVENITFLKDAAASSIWGAKAANGVIVISTKKGRYNQRTKVEFNSNVTVIDQPDLFYLKNISSSDLIDVEQYLFSKDYRFDDTSSASHPPFSPVYEILFKEKAGILTTAQAQEQINALRDKDVRNDFNKYFYQKGLNQQYSINLRGGSNNIAWILSSGFDKNISELDATYNRFSTRFENTYKATRRLEINTSLTFTKSKTGNGKPAYGSINTILGNIPTYSQFADVNDNPLPIAIKYRQSYIDTLGNGKLQDWNYYPLEDYKSVTNTSNLQDINAVVGFNYKLFDGLSFDIKYRYEKQTEENRLLYGQQSYYTRDLINNYSQLDQQSGLVTYKVPKGDILDLTNNVITAQNFRGQINFKKNWKDHDIIFIAGSEINETITKTNTYRTYGYNDDILTYVNVDYSQVYPLFVNGSDFIPNPASFGKTNLRFVSFYSNGGYTYNNKYTITASLRRDASNLFGLETNDKWKPLWSTGIGWDVSKEKFYKLKFFPYLKLRATYGKQGNIDPSKVATVTLQYLSTNPYTLTPTSQVKDFVNPDLRWEQVAMFNLGVEFSTKNNRISGSIEFYQKKMKDLYGSVPVDVTTGLGTETIIKNVGNMRGHGFDVELNTININSRIRWTSNFIINSYKDKVTKLLPLPDLGNKVVGAGYVAKEGYPVFAYFAYKWGGLDATNGDPKGYLNGQETKDYNAIINQTKSSELIYIGSLLPKISGSLGNTFTWNNISLTARVTYKFGYFFKRESINYTLLASGLTGHSDYSLRWQKPGDELKTTVPSFMYPLNSSRDNYYQNSEILATRGDNIRLQYVNVSYTLSGAQFSHLPFSDIQLYAVINNLGILWRANKEGIDPDYNSIPPSKSFAVGFRLNL